MRETYFGKLNEKLVKILVKADISIKEKLNFWKSLVGAVENDRRGKNPGRKG